MGPVDILAAKRDIGSLVGIPISRFGDCLEVSGKQSDLTPVLLLAPDAAPIADLAPELAVFTHGLVADLVHQPVPAEDTVFALCARRIRQFIDRR
jgi:hypothetical protein